MRSIITRLDPATCVECRAPSLLFGGAQRTNRRATRRHSALSDSVRRPGTAAADTIRRVLRRRRSPRGAVRLREPRRRSLGVPAESARRNLVFVPAPRVPARDRRTRHHGAIHVRPEATTLVYAHAAFTIRQIMFAPI